VRLEALATVLPLPITFESRRRQLQRFLKLPRLTFESLWFPIIRQWVKAEFEVGEWLYLAIDRTSWAGVNLLILILIVDNLTNLMCVEDAIVAGQKKFSIEQLFRDLKAGGYHLEEIAVSSERLMALLVILTIAYASATGTGKQLKGMGIQSYIGRVREPQRCEKRHSNFYINLYGQTWLNYWGYCQEMIVELMQLAPHKRQYYRKELRAMELILSAS
jgi:hypothetical protein